MSYGINLLDSVIMVWCQNFHSQGELSAVLCFRKVAPGRALEEGCISDIATACCIGTEQFRAQPSRLSGWPKWLLV